MPAEVPCSPGTPRTAGPSVTAARLTPDNGDPTGNTGPTGGHVVVADTTGRQGETAGSAAVNEPADDIRDDVSFELEDCNERLAQLVAEYADERPRGAAILRLRLGIDGERPETLTRIGARYDISRDRARQLHTKAAGELIRHATRTGRLPVPEYAHRYPVTARDSQLMRSLLTETYATDTDIAANDLAYLKLRLAGHAAADAKRVAGFVTQRIAAWRRKTNHRMTRLHDLPSAPGDADTSWLAQIDWPGGADRPAPLPTGSARALDLDDDGRGRFYLDKLGREVGFDSGLEARLLRILNSSARVRTFQDNPDSVLYRIGDDERVHFPTVAAELTDGRIVLIDVQPLGHVAFHPNRAKAEAARAYAHDNGWGWLVWTGSRLGVAGLRDRRVGSAAADTLRAQLDLGPVRWPLLQQLRAETGLDVLDFAALVLDNAWRWDRGPFRLSAPPSPQR